MHQGLGGVAEEDRRGGNPTSSGELEDWSYGAHKRCAYTTTDVPLLPLGSPVCTYHSKFAGCHTQCPCTW